jgi:hypothetical protein
LYNGDWTHGSVTFGLRRTKSQVVLLWRLLGVRVLGSGLRAVGCADSIGVVGESGSFRNFGGWRRFALLAVCSTRSLWWAARVLPEDGQYNETMTDEELNRRFDQMN